MHDLQHGGGVVLEIRGLRSVRGGHGRRLLLVRGSLDGRLARVPVRAGHLQRTRIVHLARNRHTPRSVSQPGVQLFVQAHWEQEWGLTGLWQGEKQISRGISNRSNQATSHLQLAVLAILPRQRFCARTPDELEKVLARGE